MRYASTFARLVVAGAIAVLAATAAAAQQPAKAKAGKDSAKKETAAALKAQAKVSEDSARKLAMAVVPNGTIKESELEREKGKLIYSFDITIPGKEGIEEVNIDAITGKLVGREHESEATEKKEARKEGKEGARKEARKDSTKKP
jgi:uncharacterized membrane protein YkoI